MKKHRQYGMAICPITKTQDPAMSGFSGPPIRTNSKIWARFLAKVAYGEYIRTFKTGFRSRRPAKFILQGIGDQSKIVGGRSNAPAIEYLFNTTFCALTRKNGGYFIVAYIRFFSFIESPSYLVFLEAVDGTEGLPENLPIKSDWTKKNILPDYPTGLPFSL